MTQSFASLPCRAVTFSDVQLFQTLQLDHGDGLGVLPGRCLAFSLGNLGGSDIVCRSDRVRALIEMNHLTNSELPVVDDVVRHFPSSLEMEYWWVEIECFSFSTNF
jgi:hypothetical protein